MPNIILVDENDCELGFGEKLACHRQPIPLHRAFSIFVFDSQLRLLLQRRQVTKLTWPGYWSNSCCSHPAEGENLHQAAGRRLREELGFSCELEHLFSFTYRASYGAQWGENEFDHVFLGFYDGIIHADPEEVAEVRFLERSALLAEIEREPDRFTPWFVLSLPRVLAELPGRAARR